MLALHSPYPPREREGYCLNTSSPHHGFLSFSPSHLLQTTSPGRRKGYEELLGCQDQEIAGTNCRSPGWPRRLCRACPLPSVLVQNCDVHLTAFSSYRFSGGTMGSRRTGDKKITVLRGSKPIFRTCCLQYVLVVIAYGYLSWSQYVTQSKEIFPVLYR